jgi:hypothetical protein
MDVDAPPEPPEPPPQQQQQRQTQQQTQQTQQTQQRQQRPSSLQPGSRLRAGGRSAAAPAAAPPAAAGGGQPPQPPSSSDDNDSADGPDPAADLWTADGERHWYKRRGAWKRRLSEEGEPQRRVQPLRAVGGGEGGGSGGAGGASATGGSAGSAGAPAVGSADGRQPGSGAAPNVQAAGAAAEEAVPAAAAAAAAAAAVEAAAAAAPASAAEAATAAAAAALAAAAATLAAAPPRPPPAPRGLHLAPLCRAPPRLETPVVRALRLAAVGGPARLAQRLAHHLARSPIAALSELEVSFSSGRALAVEGAAAFVHRALGQMAPGLRRLRLAGVNACDGSGAEPHLWRSIGQLRGEGGRQGRGVVAQSVAQTG